jgi:glutathione S-transferase
VSLTESNVIDQYLVDKYDKNGIFSVKTEQEAYSVKQWLGFQAASQGPFFAQVSSAYNSLAQLTMH